jgi:mannose-6-phosphate isomerase-like protein (cupin superfamily)
MSAPGKAGAIQPVRVRPKLKGDFVWHDHKETDETFIVIEGVLRIDFRDGAVQVSAGEMFIVPKGVEHKPYAEHEVKLLLIESRGALNTGHHQLFGYHPDLSGGWSEVRQVQRNNWTGFDPVDGVTGIPVRTRFAK